MKNEEILINLLLCGLLGLIGQGIRVVIGLKKLREEAAAEDAQNAKAIFNTEFNPRELWLFIGFVAGSLVNFVQEGDVNSKEGQLAIIAAGYAGTDFIEGVLKKNLPNR